MKKKNKTKSEKNKTKQKAARKRLLEELNDLRARLNSIQWEKENVEGKY